MQQPYRHGFVALLSVFGFHSSALDLDRLPIVLGLLKPDHSVSMRGITGSIKSDMLARHGEFGAESLMSLYISVDCSHQLVL